MKKRLLFFLAAILLAPFLHAQKKAPLHPALMETKPESADISTERLKRIDRVIQDYIDKKWIAGATAIITRRGKIVYYKGLGYDDMDSHTPMKRDAICRIASQTKAITSTAVMILYEEGKFLLDDPVSQYIPEFKSSKVLDKFNEQDSSYTTVPAKREITIRDLLTHVSGIGYPVIGSKKMAAIYAKADIPSGIATGNRILGTEMKRLAALPLEHQPGEHWTYGLSIDVLGYLVEVVSGMSLDQFFRQRIFEPLGMEDSYFYLPASKYKRLAVLYTEDSLHHLMKFPMESGGYHPDYPNRSGTYYSGGAGLSSTVLDYAIFLQMILNGGDYNGKRILSRNTVRIMTMNQIGDLNLGADKFGLGFEVVSEKGSARIPNNEGSISWGGYFSTTYWADPKEKLSGVIMTQIVPNSHAELGDKFKVLVYQAIND
jgi:CubicO group peptidase (beta-lactamase class C family)